MSYLTKFFAEKQIPYKHWEIEHNGITHYIDSDTVIESIMNAPLMERKKIEITLMRLDFKNGRIIDYLYFLARALVANFKYGE